MDRRSYMALSVFSLLLIVSLVFGSITEVQAFPAMSPDGKTCTPCHAEGFTGEHHDQPTTPIAPTDTPTELQELHPTFHLDTKGLYTSEPLMWDAIWDATPFLPVFSYPPGISPWDSAWN